MTDLQMLNHPYVPRINPTWLWCMIILIYFWIWFSNILLRIFASMLIKDIGLQFSFFLSFFLFFLWCLCLILVSGQCWYSYSSRSLEGFPSWFLGRISGQVLNLCRFLELAVKLSGPGVLFIGRICINVSNPLLIHFRFYVFFSLVLENCMF